MDNTLKLLIEMGVVGQGDVKAANELLAEARGTADKYTETSAELKAAKKEEGAATEHANAHHHETRLIFSEINKIVPGLGHALRAAFSGPLGPVILLGIAIHEVQEKLKEYNEDLDRQADDAYQPHLDALKALQTAWDEAAQHMAEYNAKVKSAGTDNDPIATQIKRIKELAHAQIEADKRIIESQGKLEEAAIRARDALLKKGPEETESDVTAARARTQKLVDAASDREKAGDINALKLEQQDREKDLPVSGQQKTEAEKAYAAANEKNKRDEAERARLRAEGWDRELSDEEMKKLRKEHPGDERVKLEEAEAKLTNLERLRNQGANFEMDGRGNYIPIGEAIGKATEEITAAQKSVAERRKTLGDLDKSEETRQQGLAELKIAMEKAEAAYLLDVERLKQLPAEIAQAILIEATRERGERGSEKNSAAASEMETPKGRDVAGMIFTSKGIADKIASGRGASTEEMGFLEQLSDLLEQKLTGQKNFHFQNAQAAARFFENYFNTNGYATMFQKIYDAVAAGAAQTSALSTEWQRKFTILEEQMKNMRNRSNAG